jgi:hypothetical protein
MLADYVYGANRLQGASIGVVPTGIKAGSAENNTGMWPLAEIVHEHWKILVVGSIIDTREAYILPLERMRVDINNNTATLPGQSPHILNESGIRPYACPGLTN